MQPNARELLQRAREFPWWLFTAGEIAILCNVTEVIVHRIEAEPDGPFFLDRCRPEWFLDWMRRHPGFDLSAEPGRRAVPKIVVKKSATDDNPWNEVQCSRDLRRRDNS